MGYNRKHPGARPVGGGVPEHLPDAQLALWDQTYFSLQASEEGCMVTYLTERSSEVQRGDVAGLVQIARKWKS